MKSAELYEKTMRVIDSCATLEQLEVADKFRKAASYRMMEHKGTDTMARIKTLRTRWFAKQQALEQVA